MKLGIFCMLDKKVGYMQPTFEQSNDAAIRNFAYAMKKQEYYAVNAADFALYKIGEYDTVSGIITPEPSPVFMVEGLGFGLKEGEANV